MNWELLPVLILLPLLTSGQSCPGECTSCDNGIANCLGTGIRDIPRNFPSDIKILDLSNNQLTELSSRSFQELPSLQTLRMSGNGIGEILQRSFISLPSLMSLDLSNNPTVYIQDGAFAGLTHLRMLSITNTKITRLGKFLNDVTSIHTVNMVSNQIDALEDDNFETNEQLRMIDLSQNHITTVSSKVFANLKYLRYLSLSSNPIVSVPVLEFSSTILHLVDFTNCQLEEVPGKMPASVADYRLGNNKLTELKAASFENITNLRLITLNNNQISKVEDKAFGYLEHIVEIWLSNNKLKSIPRLLPRNLHKLFLDHNGIYEIGRRNFPINSQLEVLSLDTNKVERIYNGAWDEMPMLKSINLNANKLKVVTTGSFSNISTLECLKLSNNPIELIENAALKGLTNLREISLSYLNADATQLGQDFVKSLATAENVNFVNSPGLVKSFLALIDKSNDAIMRKVNVLSLQYNELESLPFKLKRALPNVQKMLIDGNPWYCDTELKWLSEWLKTSDIVFYTNEAPVCEAPSNLQGREITSLDSSEFAKPREIIPADTKTEITQITRGDIAEQKTPQKAKTLKKKNGKGKKKRKNKKKKKKKKNKNKKKKRKNKRKGKKKGDRIKRRHNNLRKRRCVIDANGKKICPPRRQRRCTVGPDGKKICAKKSKKSKNKIIGPTTPSTKINNNINNRRTK